MGSGFEPLGAYPQNPRPEAVFEVLALGFSCVWVRLVAPCVPSSLGRASTSTEHTGATARPNPLRPVPIASVGPKSAGHGPRPTDAYARRAQRAPEVHIRNWALTSEGPSNSSGTASISTSLTVSPSHWLELRRIPCRLNPAFS